MTDRPWGMTLGTIALRRHTGQLTIESDGKRYCIAFGGGAIVAATSPVTADAIARVALTNHFITSTQLADITRCLALSPDRDEVEVIAGAVQFSPDQVDKLRRRLVAQRAARTFALDRGEFVLDDRITLPVFAGVAIDHRHVIYLGARTHLSDQRLIDDLRRLGPHFMLRPEAQGELSRFGFEPSAHPVLEALKAGTSLAALEASHRDLDPRLAQAVIYALVSCAACTISPRMTQPPSVAQRTTPSPGARAAISLFAPRTSTASPTAYSGTTAPDVGTNTPAATRPRGPSTARNLTPTPSTAHTPTPAPPAARTLPPAEMPRPTPTPTAATTVSRITAVPAAMPHTAALAIIAPADTAGSVRFPTSPPPSPFAGSAKPRPVTFGDSQPMLAPTASAPASSPRPALARTSTSDADVIRSFDDQRTPSGFLEQRTPGFTAQRTPIDQRTPTAPAIPGTLVPSRVSTDTAIAAEEAFKRGEQAMKRDQPGEAILEYKTACDLNPNEVDYAGMLAWAKFCAAGDKAAIAAETRKLLERTVFKSNRPERPRFYLGRVERMLGRDKEALHHFQEVLALRPNHAEAASEVRAIEARLQASGKPGSGLFGRKR